jgi:hypothetical protein
MSELQLEADGMPPMNADQRRAFARLTHATAHEAMTLRALNARIQRDGVTTIEGVHALIAEMLTQRAYRLGVDPDVVCDAYEAAAADQAMDLALVQGVIGHA